MRFPHSPLVPFSQVLFLSVHRDDYLVLPRKGFVAPGPPGLFSRVPIPLHPAGIVLDPVLIKSFFFTAFFPLPAYPPFSSVLSFLSPAWLPSPPR